MEDLLKIIQWRDEISQIEYMLTKLEVAEEKYVEEERYEQDKYYMEQINTN